MTQLSKPAPVRFLNLDNAAPAGARYHGLAVSSEEYLDLPEDGFKYDMIDGVLYVSPSAGFEHGSSYGQFYHLIRIALEKNPVGRATQGTDILLPDGGDVLRPDVCFIRKENLRIIKKHVHGVPDLVCEVLSESTRRRDLKEKAERYLKNGVAEYWIIDPEKETIELWKNEGQSWQKQKEGPFVSEVIGGLVVERGKFFQAV